MYGEVRDKLKKKPHLKSYAGETTHAQQPHHNTDGISGYSGYLPGLQGNICSSFPTQVKISRSYMEEHCKAIAQRPQSFGLGTKASPPPVPANSDRWGNFVMSKAKTQSLANLYLTALDPGADVDLHHGVGHSPSRSCAREQAAAERRRQAALRESLTQVVLPNTAASKRAASPAHVAGYTGYLRGASEEFGKSFNRVDAKVCGAAPPGGAQGRQAKASGGKPGAVRVTYEELNYGLHDA